MKELFLEYQQGVTVLKNRIAELKQDEKATRGKEHFRIRKEIDTLSSEVTSMLYAIGEMARYLGYKPEKKARKRGGKA